MRLNVSSWLLHLGTELMEKCYIVTHVVIMSSIYRSYFSRGSGVQ